MNKNFFVGVVMFLFLVGVVSAVPTEVDLPFGVWQGGNWWRMSADSDMQSRLLSRFGGKSSLDVVKELYVTKLFKPISVLPKRVPASINVGNGLITLLVTGEDECRVQGLEYCTHVTNPIDNKKCKKNVVSRCAFLQPSYY